MANLKPCPFCGGDAMIVKVEGSSYPYSVQCIDIDCSCRTDNFKKYEDAIKSWNKRVGEQNGND